MCHPSPQPSLCLGVTNAPTESATYHVIGHRASPNSIKHPPNGQILPSRIASRSSQRIMISTTAPCKTLKVVHLLAPRQARSPQLCLFPVSPLVDALSIR